MTNIEFIWKQFHHLLCPEEMVRETSMEHLLRELPPLVHTFSNELELYTGKTLEDPLKTISISQLYSQLRNARSVLNQMHSLTAKQPNTQNATKLISLLNDFLRTCISHIPKDMDPLSFTIQQVKLNCEIPFLFEDVQKTTTLCIGFNGFRNFVFALVEKGHAREIHEFIQSAFSNRNITAPLQRFLQGIAFPEPLEIIPETVDLAYAENVKLALLGVLADWDVLVSLPYGLALISRDLKPKWDSIRGTGLKKRATQIVQNPDLACLARDEWITVRNALAHGSAHYDPKDKSLQFRAIQETVSLPINEAIELGKEIFSASATILNVWNFYRAASLVIFEQKIDAIKRFAES